MCILDNQQNVQDMLKKQARLSPVRQFLSIS